MKVLTLSAAILGFILMSCQKTTPYPEHLPPLKAAIECLPKDGAIIAAHRGTSRDWNTAENSISALQKLIKQNYLLAEIDVAGLRDSTMITFHDGVWDDISTGKGPVISTTKESLEKILLKTRKGTYTSDRPPLFEDMLQTAKGKIYLEIDFKSSANMQNVISTIKKYDMSDQVLLIAYTKNQAKKLRNLAPNMLLSSPESGA
ncbi:MAG: glycerophosphodiester phosphodiesterase family protein, partial [Litorimonas sp.]